MQRKKRWLIHLLTGLLIVSAVICSGKQAKAAALGENVVVNPDFAGSDVSAWKENMHGATVTAAVSQDCIYGNVSTYGAITGRTARYQCFAQDITDVIENGKKYQFSFYAMLSEDYLYASAEQRVVSFSPYIVKDGQAQYLGGYSNQLSGDCSKVLTPGVWTKFEGAFLTDFGTDVEPLQEAIVDDTKEGFIVGTTMSVNDLTDAKVLALISKHFNAITPGNALKPDAIFNYSNDRCPGTETIVFNGETMTVPVTDFSRAERVLNQVLAWNAENPDKPIRVRGHVLVWHSQTPEWFFHEDYDASKAYVSKEEMNRRLEWYIMTVLQHFTGGDSPYKDLFYGWDVVNEAVSDRDGYRTDAENPGESLSQSTHGSNSSWWHVYESNEYIINAFRYANKYAPASVKLYYNDYNEFYSVKRESIVTLLKDVKAAEGTRIDGMGMQGHYDTTTPDAAAFEAAVRAYAAVVDSVQITEWDLKSSDGYDGTDAAKRDEYIRQARSYLSIYNAVKKLRGEGINIDGIVIWGTIDKNSWLHSYAGVGGSADGTRPQCPLLFDDDYMVKPAYWAFVDPARIDTYELPTETPVPTPAPVIDEETKAQVKAFVTRMYTVVLARTPDETGINNWTDWLLCHETNGAGIAYGFIMSEEFLNKELSDEAYVGVLYSTFFDRAADPEGLATWMGLLAGGASRGYVLSGFVNSDEFNVLCEAFGILRGNMSEEGTPREMGLRQFVERCYSTVLGRAGDEEGLDTWTNLILDGRMSAGEVAKCFFDSAEFLSKNTTDAEYIDTLYAAFFDRAADDTGRNDWTGCLAGGMPRTQVLEGFAGSAEFAALLASYGL